MNSEWKDFFKDIQNDYYNFEEEMNEEAECIFSEGDSECSEADGAEYMEAAIAESNQKTIFNVTSGAMGVVGKLIDSTVSDYEAEERYTGRKDYPKGQHLCVNQKYHALYVGCGKVVFYSKGYDMFPEIKLVPLSYFAKKGEIHAANSYSPYSADIIVKRAMSKLGDSSFKSSESFVKWCMGN